MQWDGAPSAGFTADGVTPWLPVADAAARNVADQDGDPASALWLCRSLIALRRAELGGSVASYQALPAPDGQWAYRVGDLVVVANFTDHSAEVSCGVGEILLASDGQVPAAAQAVTLAPWAGIIARHPGTLPFPSPAADGLTADGLTDDGLTGDRQETAPDGGPA